MRNRAALALLLGFGFACSDGDDDDTSPPPPRDGGVVVDDRDGGVEPPRDGGPSGPPPLAPQVDPEPYEVETWTYATVPTGTADPIIAALTAGTFTVPDPGEDENGIQWRAVILGDNTLDTRNAGNGTRYFCAQVPSQDEGGLIARLDGSATIYMNNAPQQGDFYRRGGLRVPLPLKRGLNHLCVRYASNTPRGPPALTLESTTDEIAFNKNDVTAPHLLTGDTSTQWVGLPVLNMRDRAVIDLTTRVVENEWFEEATLTRVGLAPGASSQLAFELRPKQPVTEADSTVEVEIRVESHTNAFTYATTVELQTLTATATHRRTRISKTDHSVQYYGVVPPRNFDPNRSYGLILALHGAAVQALGHARAYSRKDWAYVIAPTNRHPFGFDWEDWGRLDALEAMDDAIANYNIDPERMYLTGHSMGGHGTWNVGVNHPDRFAVLGPSAGWSQFDNYGGPRSPQGPGLPEAFRAAQQHSQTLDLMNNIAKHGVFVIHGSNDNNVPVSEGRRMRDEARAVTDDVQYHEQPGAGHWWNGDVAEGADCVDWTPMMDFMQARTRETNPTSFSFTTPGPWVNGSYGYVHVLAVDDPYTSATVTSTAAGAGALDIVTENVAALELDGDRLMDAAIMSVTVDGEARTVVSGRMVFGDAVKRPGAHGPFKEAFFTPFMFVYPDDKPYYRRLAGFTVSLWQLIGNGFATARPLSMLTEELRGTHNIIYLGVSMDGVVATDTPFTWDDDGVQVSDRQNGAGIIGVFPENGRVSALMWAPPGDEIILNGTNPFGSGFGYPDYFVLERRGARQAGMFDANWEFSEPFDR